MIPLTLEEVALACGGDLLDGEPGAVVREVIVRLARRAARASSSSGCAASASTATRSPPRRSTAAPLAVVVRAETAADLRGRPCLVVDDGVAALGAARRAPCAGAPGARRRRSPGAPARPRPRTSSPRCSRPRLRRGRHEGEPEQRDRPAADAAASSAADRGGRGRAGDARPGADPRACPHRAARHRRDHDRSPPCTSSSSARSRTWPPPRPSSSRSSTAAPRWCRATPRCSRRTCGATRGRLVTFGTLESDVHFVERRAPRDDGTHALARRLHAARRCSTSTSAASTTCYDAQAALAAFVELGFRLDEARPGARRVAFSDLRGEIVELDGRRRCCSTTPTTPTRSPREAALDHLAELAGGRPRRGRARRHVRARRRARPPTTAPSASTPPAWASASSPSATSGATT